MERYHYYDKLIKDYEYGVRYACDTNNIKRSVLNINFAKIRADKSVWKKLKRLPNVNII